MWAEHVVPFEILKGKTITAIDREGNERIKFATSDGELFQMSYYDDCCASCSIEEVHGDLEDLIGTPILMAEEVSSSEPDSALKEERKADYEKRKADEGESFYDSDYSPNPRNDWKEESETWTFYKVATIKGSVTIRWYGSSNGYYSESATFEQLNVGESERG